MGLSVDIYGTLVDTPTKPEFFEVEDWGTSDPSEQLWRRKELPEFMEEVEYDKEGNLLVTEEQEAYINIEIERCKKGFYFLNNGIVTYITGKHYFYVQWWKLEDDIYPDYRDTDRRYFLFLNHWEFILWCLGVIRGKKRREGASSQGCSNLMYECIFFKNSFCGLVSKTLDDSRDTFTDMVAFGYRQLPAFLQPAQINDKDSVTKLEFAHKSVKVRAGKTSTINNDKGHRSRVNYRAPVENAYDRGRISRGLWDEGGKWPKDVPFSKFISKVSKTMVKGAKRVGFCEAPSTVNEMSKSGGAEFKKVWDEANQFKSNGKPTGNQLVRYFSPAYDGYEGFIDKHGMSVIGEPTHEQYQFLVDKWVGKSALTEEDIAMGAKAYLLKKRDAINDPELLEEEIRQNPFDEDEMFMYAGFKCEFNSKNLQKQIQELEINPVYLRKVRFRDIKEEKTPPYPGAIKRINRYVDFMDDEASDWLLLEKPEKENNFNYFNEVVEPLNTMLYTVGCDTIRLGSAEHGSKATICVFKKSCVVNGVETGNYPVAFYEGRPRLPQHVYDEVIKICLWYGCKVNFEIDSGDHYIDYFAKQYCSELLYWTPAKDPNKKKPFMAGTMSANPFELAAQLEAAKIYFDGTDPVNYNGNVQLVKFPSLLKQALKYDHSDRTPSDQIIALMMALLPALKPQPFENHSGRPKEILRTYDLTKYN